jgi:hypothetical protein
MDKRKRTGRTVAELEDFFTTFPEATFCLDIAHARQVDPTMTEARQMLKRFGGKLRQVHISEIDSEGHHKRLSLATVLASQSLARLLPEHVPIIIESMVRESEMQREIDAVQSALRMERDETGWERRDWGELA